MIDPMTMCIFATRHADGSVTMRYHGPIEADSSRAKLIEAFAGPMIAEQLLTIDDIKAHAGLPDGVVLAALEGDDA